MFSKPNMSTKVEDTSEGGEEFTFGHLREQWRLGDEVNRLRETVERMAAEAGFGNSSSSRAKANTTVAVETESPSCLPAADQNVNKDGGALNIAATAAQLKTPKYAGTSEWEAFHAQFELLARARGWTKQEQALHLALCLVGDALQCLLLLSPEDRQDYDALVGALNRRFGQCIQPGLIKNELSNRSRRPGEPLRILANDIESLTRRAYCHMPPEVQSELARDQFIRALSPTELRVQVQLEHPRSLQGALELAVEREIVWGVSGEGRRCEASPTARAAMGVDVAPDRPAWAAEVTELLRAVSLQTARNTRTGPKVCWGCGQPGHLLRQCPKALHFPGNGVGSV